MGYVERRYGNYRVRYRDPSGRLTSRTFPRRAAAERFARVMEVEVSRGSWIDPRAGDVPLSVWAEQFLSLARRARKVRVTEQLIRLGPGEWVRKEPKTPASRRSITVSPVTADLLAGHLERFSLPGPDGLVFPNAIGGPLISSSFLTSSIAVTLDRYGHLLPELDEAIATAFGEQLAEARRRMGERTVVHASFTS